MKTKRKVALLILSLLFAISVTACGKEEKTTPVPQNQTTTTDAPAKQEVTNTPTKELKPMSYVGLKVYDPTYIALEKGFFGDLKVNLVDVVAGGATAVEMVSSGDVQGCLLSYMATANAVNAGLPVITVADVQSAFKQAPLEEFYVRADSDIYSIQDLKGKKIAINLVKSSFHYTWLMELEKAGMSEDDVVFVNLSFPEQKEALLNGTVDAIGLMQPYSGMARTDEKCRQLYNAVDSFGEKQFCGILLNSEWAEKNPDEACAFVEGLAKAAEWVKNNQSEAKQIMSKYTGIDANYIDDYYFQPDCSVNMADAEYWLKYMQEHEGVSTSVTVDMIATNKYNKRIK